VCTSIVDAAAAAAAAAVCAKIMMVWGGSVGFAEIGGCLEAETSSLVVCRGCFKVFVEDDSGCWLARGVVGTSVGANVVAAIMASL
jgi:hypothetical protein